MIGVISRPSASSAAVRYHVSNMTPAGDPVDADALEDHLLRDVDDGRARMRPQQRDAAAVGHARQARVQGRLGAGHLQHHVHAVTVGRARRIRATTSSCASIATCAPMRLATAQPLGVEVGGEDVPRAGHAGDGDGHQADRAAAQDRPPLWPAISSTNRAWTALPIGSWSAATSGRQALARPTRSSPGSPRTRRTRRAPARPGSAGAGTRWPARCGTGSRSSPPGASPRRPASPSARASAPSPRATTMPAISWPKTRGG